jgi:hypothetical protein
MKFWLKIGKKYFKEIFKKCFSLTFIIFLDFNEENVRKANIYFEFRIFIQFHLKIDWTSTQVYNQNIL